jgi:hypothetical protein
MSILRPSVSTETGSSKICVDCGTSIPGRHRYCQECKRKRNCISWRNKRKGLNSADHFIKRNLRIDHDPRPIDDGGFRPGALFSLGDIRDMVRLSYLTNGVVITNISTGQRYTLIDKRLMKRAE